MLKTPAFLLLFFCVNICAQDLPYQKSIHQIQLEYYNATKHTDAEYYEKGILPSIKPVQEKQIATLTRWFMASILGGKCLSKL